MDYECEPTPCDICVVDITLIHVCFYKAQLIILYVLCYLKRPANAAIAFV